MDERFDWERFGAYVTVSGDGILRVYSREIKLCGAVLSSGTITSAADWIYCTQNMALNYGEEIIHREPRS